MKRTELHRVDYGATFSYHHGGGFVLGGGQQQQHGVTAAAAGGSGFRGIRAKPAAAELSLVDLNPHSHEIGLDPKEFTAERLCPTSTFAALHSDKLPAPAAAAPAKPAAEAAAAAGGGRPRARPSAQKQQQRQAEQQKQQPAAAQEAGGSDVIVISSSDDDGDFLAFQGDDDGAAAAAAAAAQSSKKQKKKSRKRQRADDEEENDDEEQQQQQDEQQPATASGSTVASSDAGSDASSESDGGSSDGGSDDTEATGSDDDDSFIQLLGAGDSDGEQQAGGEGLDLQALQAQRRAGYRPPWLQRLAHFSSPLMRLHNEIVAFCQLLEPTAEEVASRSSSLQALRRVVGGLWPSARVEVFGSYETGLYTPASDTDVVVVDSGCASAVTGLKALASALEASGLVRRMVQVLTARVPIIKFEMVDSGLAFDVSWEVPSGPYGAQVVKGLLAEWPALKPLALVLKVFLTQRELNEVWTGGLGSYTLIIMIAAFLQLHESRRPSTSDGAAGHKRGRSGSNGSSSSSGGADAREMDGNLGVLLVDLMRLYGRVLNLHQVGISCNDGGAFYSKAARGFDTPQTRRGRGGGGGGGSTFFLSVQDPIDSSNDTARGSWNMKAVRHVFDHAYQLLTAPLRPNESLLGRIIHLEPVVAGRPVPPWCVEAPSVSEERRRQQRQRSPSRSGDRSRHRSSHRHDHDDSRRGGRRRRRSRSREHGRSKRHRGSKHDRHDSSSSKKKRDHSSGSKRSSGGGGGKGSSRPPSRHDDSSGRQSPHKDRQRGSRHASESPSTGGGHHRHKRQRR